MSIFCVNVRHSVNSTLSDNMFVTQQLLKPVLHGLRYQQNSFAEQKTKQTDKCVKYVCVLEVLCLSSIVKYLKKKHLFNLDHKMIVIPTLRRI